MEVLTTPISPKEKNIFIKRINKSPNDKTKLKIGSIIFLENLINDLIFEYDNQNYKISDFEKLTLQFKNKEINNEDYKYIDWNNLPDESELTIKKIVKSINKIGCKIKKTYGVDTVAYIVQSPTPIIDNQLICIKAEGSDRFTYANKSEWVSDDTDEMYFLTDLAKIKAIFSQNKKTIQYIINNKLDGNKIFEELLKIVPF